MANPNIVNVATINGNTAVANVTTTATAIVTNSAASGKIYKINGLIVTNVGASSANLTVDIYRSSAAYAITSALPIPINTTYTPIDKTLSLYLLEGDSIRLTASANSIFQAVCTWEEIS